MEPRQLTARTLAECYDAQCELHGCKVNSQVRSMLASIGATGAPSRSPVTIDLSQNIIGSRGIAPLITVFGKYNGLRGLPQFFLNQLVLRGNFLSNSDVDVLCDTIENLQSHNSGLFLENLDVSDNPISQPAGKRLHLLVARLSSIRTLVLDQTLINVGLQARIQRVLSSRRQHRDRHSPLPISADCTEPRREGTPIVAPSARLRALHVLFTTSLNVCVDPASLTHLTTTVHEPLALLMRSSRVYVESESVADPMHLMYTPRSRNSDGVFPSRAVIDIESEIPTGTIGHWLLKQFDSSSSPSDDEDPHRRKGILTSPFDALHLLFALPKDTFMGVELLMQSGVLHYFSKAGIAHSEFPTLGTLRATSEAMLRDPERAGLNLLLASAFDDPQPLFTEIPTAIDSPASPGDVRHPLTGSSIGSPFEGRGIRLPQVMTTAAEELPPLPAVTTVSHRGAEGNAVSSLLSESSLMSSAAEAAERKSRSSASLRDDQMQQLMRATPLGPLMGLMELCEQEAGGAAAPISLLRPTLAVLSSSPFSQSPAPPPTPPVMVG